METSSKPNALRHLCLALPLHLMLYLLQWMAVNYVYIKSGKSLTAYMVASILTVPIVFLLPLVLYCKRSGYSPFRNDFQADNNGEKAISQKRLSIRSAFIFICASAAVVTAVNVFGMLTDAVVSLFTELPPATLPQGSLQFALTFIKTVLLAPVLEEMLFRGAIVHAFSDRSDRFKIFISALLFALMHYSLTAIPYAFAAGLVISFFAVKTKSIRYGISLHFVSNLTTFIFSLLSSLIAPATYDIISTIAFWVFFALTLAGGQIVLSSYKKDERISDKAQNSGEFPPELILYVIFAVIMAIMNF